jgi:hypothetical protein
MLANRELMNRPSLEEQFQVNAESADSLIAQVNQQIKEGNDVLSCTIITLLNRGHSGSKLRY